MPTQDLDLTASELDRASQEHLSQEEEGIRGSAKWVFPCKSGVSRRGSK